MGGKHLMLPAQSSLGLEGDAREHQNHQPFTTSQMAWSWKFYLLE